MVKGSTGWDPTTLYHEKRPTDGTSFFMVHHAGKLFHEIRDDLEHWKDILTVPYQLYLQTNQFDWHPGVTRSEIAS